MFGPVALRLESRLEDGELRLEVSPPPRTPKSLLVRPPLPSGWIIKSARLGANELPIGPGGVLDLSGVDGRISIRMSVAKSPE